MSQTCENLFICTPQHPRLTQTYDLSKFEVSRRKTDWYRGSKRPAKRHVVIPISDQLPEFRALVKVWKEETKFLSSTHDIVTHPSYQRIMTMGHPAIRWILKELQHEGGSWFWALRHMTGANPVKKEDLGRVNKMTEAWLEWGRKNL